MTQTQQRTRGYDCPLTEINYTEQAQKDFAMYARMDEAELAQYLRRWQHPRKGRIGRKKNIILEMMQANPNVKPAEAAYEAGVSYNYAWRVMRGIR